MTDESTIKLNIIFSDPCCDIEESDEKGNHLPSQQIDQAITESHQIASDSDPIQEKTTFPVALIGRLTAEVDITNIKRFWDFLSDRLTDKVVEMEVETKGKTLKIKTYNQEELIAAVETARKFVME